MTFSKKAILLSGILLCISVQLGAQVRQTREEYISRYMPIAIAHMERYGIPASITMAQGILESDCGNSLLSMKSNNHFGIKCKRNWTGDKVYHDDDAKGECFRSYPSVEASYRDHAEFLDSQPRYDSLFAYSSDDYKSWARGLKAAGKKTKRQNRRSCHWFAMTAFLNSATNSHERITDTARDTGSLQRPECRQWYACRCNRCRTG